MAIPRKSFDFGPVLGTVKSREFEEVTDAIDNNPPDDSHEPDEAHVCIPSEPGPSAFSKSPSPHPISFSIRSLCLVIAACAAIVSGANSFEFFCTLRPTGLAILTAISLVGSAGLLPDLGIIFYNSKHYIYGTVVIIAGLIAIGLCMATTLSTLYNTRTSRTATTYTEDATLSEAKRKISAASLEKSRVVLELERLNTLIDSTQKKIDSLPPGETLSDTSQVLVGRLNRYMKDKKVYEDKVSTLDVVVSSPLPQGSVHRADFYSFISSVLGIKGPDQVEFLIGAVPAIFLEIITPIMLGVFLFL